MPTTTVSLTDEQHEQCARALFNLTWSYLDKPDRSADEDDLMVHAAHASAWHWRQVGRPLNFARSHWQLARVYCAVGRAESALHHAGRSLAIAEESDLGPFDLGFAHEAMARALALAGRGDELRQHLKLARQQLDRLEDAEDRRMLQQDLATVPVLGTGT